MGRGRKLIVWQAGTGKRGRERGYRYEGGQEGRKRQNRVAYNSKMTTNAGIYKSAQKKNNQSTLFSAFISP